MRYPAGAEESQVQDEVASSTNDLGSRSWFNRLSGVYNVAERQIARGARALQKFAAPLSQGTEVEEAQAQLEQLARSVRGTEREKCVRHWLDLLEKSSSRNVMHSPMIVAEPAATGGDEEDEWQQLSSLPASNRMNQQPSDLMAGPFPEKSFRAFFLRSKAFQLLMEGYIMEPPANAAEQESLHQLMRCCCYHHLHVQDLQKALGILSNAQVDCAAKEVQADAIQSIAHSAGEAISGLQISAISEELDDKLEILREEIAEQAATAALLHKFNYGDQSPNKEVSQKKLAQGLVATHEVMMLVEALCRRAEAKMATLPSSPSSCNNAQLIDQVQQRTAFLASSLSLAEIELSENLRQQQESRAFKGSQKERPLPAERKMVDMEDGVSAAQADIKALQAKRAALLAQLENVELSLAKAQAKRADAEEGRNVFEEGSNFTLQALEQQATQLCRQQQECEAETAALDACQGLLQIAQQAQQAQDKSARESTRDVILDVAAEYSHAATRHLYFQRANLQLLLRKLKFCGTELAESNARHERATKLGMDHLLAELGHQQQHLIQQYLEAEATTLQHLDEVGLVYERTQEINDRAKRVLPPHRSIEQGEEMQEILSSIGKLKESFDALDRLTMLPEPSEISLQPQTAQAEEISRPQALDAASDETLSRDDIEGCCEQRDGRAASPGKPDSEIQAFSSVMADNDLGLAGLLESRPSGSDLEHQGASSSTSSGNNPFAHIDEKDKDIADSSPA